MNKLMFKVLLLLATSVLISCQAHKKTGIDESLSTVKPVITAPESNLHTQCKSPRHKMCTREFRPVCATRDTGVRCITTPCPSTEKVIKSNACTACSDEKVSSYSQGACK